MKRLVKKLVTFRCEICRTEHTSKTKARECERMPVEEKVAKVGDRAVAVEQRGCANDWDKKYVASGKVVRISRPEPPHPDYFLDRSKHVRTYYLRITCPHCGQKQDFPYYAHQLRFVSRNKAVIRGQGKRAG